MYEDYRRRYGARVRITRLYGEERDCWAHFKEEMDHVRNSGMNWERDFGDFLESTRNPEEGNYLHAAGYYLLLCHHYSFRPVRPLDTASKSQTENEEFEKVFSQCECECLTQLKALLSNTSVLWVDAYTVGSHVIKPLLELLKQVEALGVWDRIVIFISDLGTRKYFEENPLSDSRIILLDWYLEPTLQEWLPSLKNSVERRLEEQVEGLSGVLKKLFYDHRNWCEGELKKSLLYAKWLGALFQIPKKQCYLNILDNRKLSTAFHLLDKSNRPQSVQMQHGFCTSASGPFWADEYLTWKDAHTLSQYRYWADESRVRPVGNFFLNSLRFPEEKEWNFPWREQRVFLFIFQGPPYWHVTNRRLLYAIEILKRAVSDLPKNWDIAIKLRSREGRGFLEDYLGDLETVHRGRVHIVESEIPPMNLYNGVDAVGLISTSTREEVAFLGKPIYSIEPPEDHEDHFACLSFVAHGMCPAIHDSQDLLDAIRCIQESELKPEVLSKTWQGELGRESRLLCGGIL
ncbi:MAG: hypothetical protein ACPGN3_05155 [Opitutales bacterium]